MDLINVYRLECDECGYGPYWCRCKLDEKKERDIASMSWDHRNTISHPVPNFPDNSYVVGIRYKKDFKKWFGKWLQIQIDNGFKLYKYRVSDYVESNGQILFKKENCKKKNVR